MAYEAPTFVNGSTPALNATNMNALAGAVENLGVENGGTGKQSITSGALIKGNGTSAVGEVLGTGAVYATTSGSPTFGTLPVSCGGTGKTSLDALKTEMGLGTAGFIVSQTQPASTTVLWINPDDSVVRYYYNSQWIPVRGVFA